jgi:hypothetical protein
MMDKVQKLSHHDSNIPSSEHIRNGWIFAYFCRISPQQITNKTRVWNINGPWDGSDLQEVDGFIDQFYI